MSIDPNLIIFYVTDPLVSAEFYANLLGIQPIERAPTFAMFLLKSGVRLGLWAKNTVEPQAEVRGGGTELVWEVASKAAIDELYTLWQEKGLVIIQPPTLMDFGYTFTAMDPDQHRLRLYFRIEE